MLNEAICYVACNINSKKTSLLRESGTEGNGTRYNSLTLQQKIGSAGDTTLGMALPLAEAATLGTHVIKSFPSVSSNGKAPDNFYLTHPACSRGQHPDQSVYLPPGKNMGRGFREGQGATLQDAQC